MLEDPHVSISNPYEKMEKKSSGNMDWTAIGTEQDSWWVVGTEPDSVRLDFFNEYTW